MIRLLLCCMAVMLAFTSAFAAETTSAAPERITLLAVQGSGTSGEPTELMAALAVLPVLDFDQIAFYDGSHCAVSTLDAEGYGARGAAFDAFCDTVSKARVRNASHVSLWNAVSDYTADPSLLNVIWIPSVDVTPEQWEDVAEGISRVTASGGRVRIYAGTQLPVLSANAGSLINVDVVPVANPTLDTLESLLSAAGYYHHTTEAIAEILRTTEVHPAGSLPGDTVIVDWSPLYDVVGSTYTYGAMTIGGAGTDTGMAVVHAAAPVSETESSAPAETAITEPGAQLVLSSEGETSSIDSALAAIAQQHQLCWYFRPSADLGVQAAVDPAVVPYGIEPKVTFTLTLSPAIERQAVTELCSQDLLAEGSRFMLSAVLRGADGAEQPLELRPSDRAGAYTFAVDRTAGEFTVDVTLSLRELPYSYPVMSSTVVMEAPLQVTAAQNVEPIRLNVSPMLWHGGETQAALAMENYFTGSFMPVVCKNSDADMVQVEGSGNRFQLTALREGKTQLFFLSRDGVTGVLVPVEIENGQKQVLAEALIALAVIALVLYTLLYARSQQPRFRKGEQLRVEIEGGVSFTQSVKSYRGSGVTLWRLLVVSGNAASFKQDSASLKRIAFVPKHDRVILKNDKSVDQLIAGQPAMLQCGSFTFTVTLEATRPEA